MIKCCYILNWNRLDLSFILDYTDILQIDYFAIVIVDLFNTMNSLKNLSSLESI